MAGEWGWRLHWQDFTHHQFGLPKPEAQHQDFRERADAEAARGRIAGPSVVATVATVPMPVAERSKRTRARNKASRLIDPPPIQRRPYA